MTLTCEQGCAVVRDVFNGSAETEKFPLPLHLQVHIHYTTLYQVVWMFISLYCRGETSPTIGTSCAVFGSTPTWRSYARSLEKRIDGTAALELHLKKLQQNRDEKGNTNFFARIFGRMQSQERYRVFNVWKESVTRWAVGNEIDWRLTLEQHAISRESTDSCIWEAAARKLSKGWI